MGGELITADDCLGIRDDECLESIDTDILHINILHQRMEHLTFCITHITLQLRQQSNGSSGRHRLEHILLPVLSHRRDIGGNVC